MVTIPEAIFRANEISKGPLDAVKALTMAEESLRFLRLGRSDPRETHARALVGREYSHIILARLLSAFQRLLKAKKNQYAMKNKLSITTYNLKYLRSVGEATDNTQ